MGWAGLEYDNFKLKKYVFYLRNGKLLLRFNNNDVESILLNLRNCLLLLIRLPIDKLGFAQHCVLLLTILLNLRNCLLLLIRLPIDKLGFAQHCVLLLSISVLSIRKIISLT